MKRAELIVQAARAALGTKFRHQGRSLDSGLDCAGLAIHCARAAGIEPYDENDYPRQPGGGRMESAFDKQAELERIPAFDLRDGDILLMTFEGQPQHVAIVAGINIIHAYEPSGRVVEHGLTYFWKRKIVRSYRFVEVES